MIYPGHQYYYTKCGMIGHIDDSLWRDWSQTQPFIALEGNDMILASVRFCEHLAHRRGIA